MYGKLRDELTETLAGLREAGTYKTELVMTTPQGAHVGVEGRGELLNLCANNYLGLANHPSVVAAAHEALDRWGYGMASVRFICGTQALHRELEDRLSAFLGNGRHDPLLLVLRRERRPVRSAADRGGCGDLGSAEPRLDHRRDPALQSSATPLRER